MCDNKVMEAMSPEELKMYTELRNFAFYIEQELKELDKIINEQEA